MKLQSLLSFGLGAFASMALGGASVTLHAQTPDKVVSTFDSEEEVVPWVTWWGAAPQVFEFDPAVDADGSAISGSLKATVDFDLAAYGGDNQFAFRGDFADGVIDGTQYTNLVFDLRWASTSPQRSFGDFGALEIGFRNADFSQGWVHTIAVPVEPANGWIHVVAPIDPALPGLGTIGGVVFKMWSGDPVWGQTGTATFWIDNVRLEGNTTTEIPAPRLSIEKAAPGLRLVASAPGAQYQRQSIRTVEPTRSFVGDSGPVTYSFTISDYPDADHAGFQSHIFLVPGDSVAATDNSPDYSQPNIVFLDLQNNGSGGATATFRHKIDQANGNSMIYNSNPESGPVGSLASISSSQVVGTWSMTFNNDTNITVTTPEGTSTNFTWSAETAARFANPLYTYFGIQPNQPTNIYQSAQFSAVNITGVDSPINETFAGVQNDPENPRLDLDATIWERVAANAAGVQLVPADAGYWVKWTAPAVGFVLQTTTDLTSNQWTDVAQPAAQVGNSMEVLVPASTDQRRFYRLVKP